MNADDCSGSSFVPGRRGSATEDLYGGETAQSVSTSENQQSYTNCFIRESSIKTDLYSGISAGVPPLERKEEVRDDYQRNNREVSVEDSAALVNGRRTGHRQTSPRAASPGPARLPNGKLQCDVCGIKCLGPNVLMVHKRSHTGERPFQCEECGAAFTQKGNLLRHTKLHSGEKPFKCSHCNYACRRKDALAGHLRTHAEKSSHGYSTVGKPFQCGYCGRSYKQQSTLGEHYERRHIGLQSLDPQPAALSSQPGQDEESKSPELVTKPLFQPSTKTAPLTIRLANSIIKRKRSTPQKFLGEKHIHLAIPEGPFEFSLGIEKEGDRSSQHPKKDLAEWLEMVCRNPIGSTGGGSYMPLNSPWVSDSDADGDKGEGEASVAVKLAEWEVGEGHSLSPNKGCKHFAVTERTPKKQSAVPASKSKNRHPTSSLFCPIPGKDLKIKRSSQGPVTSTGVQKNPDLPLSSKEMVQVVDGDGRPLCSFHCEHCRILFLDHVMFTIHMGCHGFHQPLECKVCGHCSQDCYEFTSHIVRGKHF